MSNFVKGVIRFGRRLRSRIVRLWERMLLRARYGVADSSDASSRLDSDEIAPSSFGTLSFGAYPDRVKLVITRFIGTQT